MDGRKLICMDDASKASEPAQPALMSDELSISPAYYSVTFIFAIIIKSGMAYFIDFRTISPNAANRLPLWLHPTEGSAGFGALAV